MFKSELKIETGLSNLNEISTNKTAQVIEIPNGVIKSQLLRFGIFEGQFLECISKLPGGTIVLKINRQEIAVGASLAKKIKVVISKN